MARAGHNLNNFLSQIQKTDLARSNRFEIHFNLPPFMPTHTTSQGSTPRLISMLAEDIMFPGTLIGTKPLRLNNLNEQRANAIDFGGDSITFTFLIDTSWSAKDMFGDWMRKIVDPKTRYVAYPNDYYSTVDIYALNAKDETVAH